MNKVLMVGGGKGGVGKSSVAMALLDTLKQAGHSCVYVETDDSNPDVYKAVHASVESEICNLDSEAGFIKLGGLVETNQDACIVVNTAARATDALVKFGGILCDVCAEQQRELVMLWVLNRQRDGLELLRNWMDSEQLYSGVYAVLNTYFGEASKFVRYNDSKLKTRLSGTMMFPELNDLVADKLIDTRAALWDEARATMSIAERSALNRFRIAAREALGVVV